MILLAVMAAASGAPVVVEAAAVPATAISLIALVPLSADPVLFQAKLRRPVVYVDAPPVMVVSERTYALRTVPQTGRSEDFVSHMGSAPAEPAWSPALASLEMGRNMPRKVGRGPFGGAFALRVTDQTSEPSVGGIAGALLRISENTR